MVRQFNEDDEQKNNPTNPPNPPNPHKPPKPPKSTATVEIAKDPPIHTSSQREESSAINLDVALDDCVLNKSPPNELKNTTIKDVVFASPNLSFIELNYGRSCMSTMSSITASPSIKNTPPALKSCSRKLSLHEDFATSKDEKQQAMNLINAIEKLEKEKKETQERHKRLLERQKHLLDEANRNPLVGELLKSTKRKLADYNSTELSAGMDPLGCLEKESSVLRKDVPRKRRKGDVGKVFDIISENNDDTSSQASALGKVLRHKTMKSIVKEAGFVDKEDNEYKVGEKMKQNQQTYIQRALTTENIRGRATDDKRSAAECIVTSILTTPDNVAASPVQKGSVIKRLFNLPKTSAKRLVKKCAKKRFLQKHKVDEVRWSSVAARRKYSKITADLKEKLHNWILRHPHVIKSPYPQDTLLWKKMMGLWSGYQKSNIDLYT